MPNGHYAARKNKQLYILLDLNLLKPRKKTFSFLQIIAVMKFVDMTKQRREQFIPTMMSISILLGVLVGSISVTAFASETNCTGQAEILMETDYVPFDQQEKLELTKHLNCTSSNMSVTFAISTWMNGTYIVCACDKKIYGGYCVEVNNGAELIIQANQAAPCNKFSRTPCPIVFNSSESYLYRQCYEKHGNILSPQQMVFKNQNYQRIIEDLKKKILNCENKTQEQNETITELTMCANKLKMIQNEEQSGSTVLVIVSCSIILVFIFVILAILGNPVLFIIQKYKNRDTTLKFCDFCRWRLVLVKCLLFTSDQTQLLQYCNSNTINQTQESNSEQRPVDGNNGVSISIDEPTQSTGETGPEEKDANEIEGENKAEKEHDNNYDHGDDEESSTEDEALLSDNMEQMGSNDVNPEKTNGPGENIVNLQMSTKINKMVLKTEEKSRVYSKDRKQKETFDSNIENMKEVDKAEAPVVNTY